MADIGANIGLHTIVLSKLGYKVDSYEPDEKHFKLLIKNLKKNKLSIKNTIKKEFLTLVALRLSQEFWEILLVVILKIRN